MQILQIFASQLSNATEIAGVPLIAVKKLELYKPPKNDTPVNPIPEPQTPVMSTEGQSNNNLAIILGVVIPSVIIILVVIVFVFRLKIFKKNNTQIVNLPQDVNQIKEDVQAHRRKKLSPIVHQTHLTPVKQGLMGRLGSTGDDKNFWMTPQQSHEQLNESNEKIKAEAVHEFDSGDHGHQSVDNLDQEMEREDAQVINSNSHKQSVHEKIVPNQSEAQEFVLADDTLREMNRQLQKKSSSVQNDRIIEHESTMRNE